MEEYSFLKDHKQFSHTFDYEDGLSFYFHLDEGSLDYLLWIDIPYEFTPDAPFCETYCKEKQKWFDVLFHQCKMVYQNKYRLDYLFTK
jgi:hypothetical protein